MPKSNPLKPPKKTKVKSPILEKAGSPGGPHTPGAKKKRKKTELERRLQARRDSQIVGN